MPRQPGTLAGYLRECARLCAVAGPAPVLVAVAGQVAGALDLPAPDGPLRAALDGEEPAALGRDEQGLPPPPAGEAAPELLSTVYAALLAGPAARRTGAVYTPAPVARRLAAEVLDRIPGDPSHARVCDPAAGAGAFLVAAGRHLIGRGGDPQRVVANLTGVDVDPLAAAVTDAALTLLGGQPGRPRLHVGDALDEPLDEAGPLGPGRFDAVLGNPPFLNQLETATTRHLQLATRLRRRFGAAAGGYADTANLFLLLALDLVRPGGCVGMIQPDSFLAARDAAATRREVAGRARLEWVWRSLGPVFPARVQVCAPVLRAAPPDRARLRVARAVAPDLRPAAAVDVEAPRLAAAPTWSWLFADVLGVPAPTVLTAGRLGTHCRATADFRDQFYGLVPFVYDGPLVRDGVDGPGDPPLVTSGLLDPARCLWGRRRMRFAGRPFIRPRVDLARLRAHGRLGAWANDRLVPKVLLATQTRVLEPAVDVTGQWLPGVPVITVLPVADRTWHVGAALVSPVLTAWALREYAGSALTPDAIKLSARQVAGLPAPRGNAAWDDGAAAFRAACGAPDERVRRAELLRCGVAMSRAYGLGTAAAEPLLSWWAARLPSRDRPQTTDPVGRR